MRDDYFLQWWYRLTGRIRARVARLEKVLTWTWWACDVSLSQDVGTERNVGRDGVR